MQITARVENGFQEHRVTLSTDSNPRSLDIPPKASGYGSSANGGELLFLALATCYCNDIYREATKRGIKVESVTVQVDGEFGAAGMPAQNVTFRARVTAQAGEKEIRELMEYTDQVSEIQNTLRVGTPIRLEEIEAVTVPG